MGTDEGAGRTTPTNTGREEEKEEKKGEGGFILAPHPPLVVHLVALSTSRDVRVCILHMHTSGSSVVCVV